MTDLVGIDLSRVTGAAGITQFPMAPGWVVETAGGFAPKQVKFTRTVGRMLRNVAMAAGTLVTWELLPHKR